MKDVKRANVFWLDPEDPQVDGDKDQLVEITQKSEMIENLQNSGQSTENIDDYDLSEITLKEDGISDKIQMEGRTSTIYGCYVVYEPVQVLTYDDDQVTVTVSAAEEGIIPANAELKVVSITAEDKNTEDQYKEVEQKLQEKAQEDAYDIAGFLAYDITFVDEDGNETEPGGEVKVSIDYKEAAIPETISEEDAANAEVTVLHLEEDEKGEVKEVVDMAQDEKVDVLVTTEENKVEKAEVRTESFSTFTITWWHDNELRIQIIDDSADGIGENQEIPMNDLEDLNTKDGMSPKDIAKNYNISGYTFLKAVIGNNIDNKNDLDRATGIIRLRYYDWKWEYKNENSSGGWKSLDNNKVYFVYRTSSSKEVKVYFVSGEDGTKIKPSMTLEEFFNEYSDGGTIQETKELAPEIESYRFVKTVVDDIYNRDEGTTNDSRYWVLRLRENYNGSYQYNKARTDSANNNQWQIINKPVYFIYKEDTGIVSTRNSTDDGITLKLFNYDKSINTEAIAAGFPFHNNSTNNVDGTYNDNTGGNVRSTLGSHGYPVSSNNNTELDFLFGKNAMEANYLFQYNETTRSYEYDSELNHALYDEDEERFYVYDYQLGPTRTGGNFGESYSPFNVGNFFPFNDVIDPEHGELNFIQSGRENRTNIDYWFGMSMGLTFYQPTNGKIANEPMKFEFRGDDDVFVYLDGVLILDLGGIHAAQEGNIDFSTGIVTEVTENTTTKSIYELYEDSRLFTDQELAQKFKKVTINGREYMIFRDDTNIEMNFFYLERGAGASNCHIKFNMPPIPENTIIVGKEIDNANAYVYSNVEFSFKLELKGEDSDSFESVANTTVKVYDKAGNVIDEARPVDENGIFKLKHGEQAYFPDIPITTQYKVTELDVDSVEYENIKITGVTINQIKGDGESSTIYDWVTEELLVAETPRVIFHNVIDPELNTEFRITKKLISDVSSQEIFQIKIYLGDEANKDDGQAYTGEYSIAQEPLFANDGIIRLEADQTATISRLPSGTSFKVVEVDPNTGLETEIYADPSYNIKYDPRNDASSQIDGQKDAATGTTVLGNTEVTVVNSYNPKIVVEKEWKPGNPSNETEIKVGLYKLAGEAYVPTDQTLTLKSPDWNGKFEGLESGIDYTVKELQEVSDSSDAEFTIDGKTYKGVEEGQSVEIGGSNYSVNYETSSNGQITTITITNSIADEWKIVKKSSSKNSDGTNADVPAGAKFTLIDSEKNIRYDGEVLEGNQGVISWSRNKAPVENSEIEAGTYVLKEIQAPAGFAISNEEWTLIFAAKGAVPTIMKGGSEYKVEPIEENGKKVYTFIFENTPIFDLPSAGSSGIFGYTMGGTLLLMAGTLILYKMKRKEVQES